MIAILTASRPNEPWPEMPIKTSRVRQGKPVARGLIVSQTVDKKTSSGFWSCTPGEFEWCFTGDEFIYLFEGEVIISDSNGKRHALKAGDVAYFPMGLHCVWHVIQTIKQFFVIRTPEPINS